MQEEIIFSGFGGQGIMLMGRILAETALIEGKNVTWLPSYGAEVRGGTAHCMVKISDGEVASPMVNKPDTCIAMNQLAADKYVTSIKNKGLLIINSSLAKNKPARKDIKIISVPLTDIAAKLGNIKVANTVALGVYLAAKKNLKTESLIAAMRKLAPKDKPELLEINQNALKEGLKLK
ncbi:MAG: 2-oxoacid:acceptor oxidoreductase family protein [Candidatus Omnitrophica bacterium]|nr:2-oxoacid:acceptor oxidoreductase family protein [Candidatus Omnitrophota bacterium]HOX54717.1 2-oxoacid:acceptor oxidoreductase family protein [Candidatus Omnitrophota bacterium]